MSHGHDVTFPAPPANLRLPGWTFVAAAVAVLAGAAAFAWTLKGGHPEAAWAAWLAGAFLALGLGVFGAAWMAILSLSKGIWSVTMRRVPEAMTAFILPGGILLAVAGLGGHHLWHWMDPQAVAADALLTHKKPFLNTGMFWGFTAFTVALWTVFSFLMVRNSLQQDRTGKVEHSRRNTALSAIFIVLFALTFSGLSFLYLMSLEPHWFSTMFAVVTFTDMMQAGLAFVCFVAAWLVARGSFQGFVNEEHLHAAGKMLFATTGFWAYIYFCQYLLIWYANLPEETSYFLRRMENGWLPWMLALPVLKFVVPFLLLIPRAAKRTPWRLMALSAWILLAQALEMFLMVTPSVGHGDHAMHAHLPWVEALVIAGFLGAFWIVFGVTLQRRPPVPLKDPFIRASLQHHT